MNIYKKIKTYIIIISILITLPKQSKTEILIDFNNYEKENTKSLPIEKDIENEENFREKLYKKSKTIKNENDFFFQTGKPIPKFNITSEDMTLNKWIINYKTKNHKIIERKLITEKENQTNINKLINLKQYLWAHIHFPHNSKYANIKTPFEIYPYNKQGKIINIGNGVIYNTKKINEIYATIGTTKGNFKNISISLKLKNEKNYIEEYHLGFLHLNERKQNIKLFKQKNDNSFIEEIKQESIKDNTSYYKVYYKNNEIYRWQLIEKNKIKYQEILLKWKNPSHSNRKNDIKPYQKKEIYPSTIPFVIFQEIILKKHTENKIKNFHIIFKNIKVFYDKKVNDNYIELHNNDEDIWNIVSKTNKEKRRLIEIKNAKTLLDRFEKGKKQGFTDYNTFKKYFKYIP